MKRIRRICTISFLRQLFLFIETFILLGLSRFLILVLPFRLLAPVLGKLEKEPIKSNKRTENPETLRKIKYMLGSAALKTPWQSLCLVKALTAVIMLRRRKLPSTVFLGVAKNQYNQLCAHAWLCSDDFEVCGYENAHEFKSISQFSRGYSENATAFITGTDSACPPQRRSGAD